MPSLASLHAPTLLVVIVLTNAIVAATLWRRYVRTARAGLRTWAAGLMLETLAAALLLGAGRFGDIALLAAAAALALGIATQIRASYVLLQRQASAWLLVSGPALAIAAFAKPALSMHRSTPPGEFGVLLLVLHCLTIASSLAFIVAARNTDSIFRR